MAVGVNTGGNIKFNLRINFYWLARCDVVGQRMVVVRYIC